MESPATVFVQLDTQTADQRRELRFDINAPSEVTVLGDAERRMPARLINGSGRGLCLLTSQAITPGAALRVDIGSVLLLGEVMYCRAEGAEFRIGVEVEHSLASTGELARLMRSILRQDGDAWQAQ